MLSATLPNDRGTSFRKETKSVKGPKGTGAKGGGTKGFQKKKERHVKTHIETLMKGRPIRFRVIAFAQRVAAKKI